ncbi:S-layer homology domain-containing protein [Bacillus sp. FJAT-42315]|uniref:S-layer homology domain-containing protein n=1 Tax=Bacillus sp. FJAT-42315 TaxID=2014077 RepID=UPI000C230F3C|nr:S-layer homology domain-containing protein [Bacillus sp. FJAT-42315]
MKKLVASLCFSFMLLFGFSSASATSFKDVPANHPAAKEMEWAKKNGFLNGYKDGKFYPNNKLTEAQFVAMMANYYQNISSQSLKPLKGEHWSEPYYREFKKYKIPLLDYYSTYGRSYPITRGEMARFVAAGQNVASDGYNAVQYMYKHKISQGKSSRVQNFHTYGYNDELARWHAAKFLYNLHKAGIRQVQPFNISKAASPSFQLKDANGQAFEVNTKKMNGIYGYATFDDGPFSVWAGAGEGDLMFRADYQLTLHQLGNPAILSRLVEPNYEYNYTRNLIRVEQSTIAGQGDLLFVEATMSSNFRGANVYMVKDGQLVQLDTREDFGLYYTWSPRLTAKNQLQTLSYYNHEASWYLNTYRIDTKTEEIYDVGSRKISNKQKDDFLSKWY